MGDSNGRELAKFERFRFFSSATTPPASLEGKITVWNKTGSIVVPATKTSVVPPNSHGSAPSHPHPTDGVKATVEVLVPGPHPQTVLQTFAIDGFDPHCRRIVECELRVGHLGPTGARQGFVMVIYARDSQPGVPSSPDEPAVWTSQFLLV